MHVPGTYQNALQEYAVTRFQFLNNNKQVMLIRSDIPIFTLILKK
jgi:hypothetical protein